MRNRVALLPYTTRRAMYVYRNIAALSYCHCCCGKAITITYSVSESVALGIQHAIRMRHIVIRGMPDCKLFSTLSLKRQDFPQKSYCTCAFLFSATFVWSIFYCKKNWARSDDKVRSILCKVPFFRPILTKLEFLVRFSKKFSNTKFHENPFRGSR